MHLAADSFQQNRSLLDGRQPTEFTRGEAMKLMPRNAWMCMVCGRAQPEGLICVYCDRPRKETGFVTYPSPGEPAKVIDAELPTVFNKLDPKSAETKRMRQQRRKHAQAVHSMRNYLKPENHPWRCQHKVNGKPCLSLKKGRTESENPEDYEVTLNPAMYDYCRKCQKEPDDPILKTAIITHATKYVSELCVAYDMV